MTAYLALDSPARGRAQRGGLLVVIGALHVLAIFWLVSQSSLATVAPVEGVISLIDIAAPPGGAPAREPREAPKAKTETVAPLVVVASPSPVVVAAPAQSSLFVGGGRLAGGGCELAQAVGQAILGEAAAVAELETLPPEARTQADAVMLWDGRWPGQNRRSLATIPGPFMEAAESPQPGVLRQVIEQAIRDAPLECREAVVNGPRFIALPGPSRTTMVVIGSGAWRWADLIVPDKPCPEANHLTCISNRTDPTWGKRMIN